MKRREDLSTPRQGRSLGVHYDPEAFGRFSARTLGTARFLVIQTVVVAIWIALNIIGWFGKWDPYPFILLNLAFSTQAAYAAPLILLAQSRQAERDRVQSEQDRLSEIQRGLDYIHSMNAAAGAISSQGILNPCDDQYWPAPIDPISL